MPLGFVLGAVSFFALTVPYLWLLVQFEKRRQPAAMTAPPRAWAYLFVPVMVATLLTSAVAPWLVIDLLR